MSKPEISVIIPLYNHEDFIEQTIQSVLEQSFQDFEIVIVDDGSTDNSVEFVKRIADSRIRLFCQENRGAHNALNTGISHACGRYIAILNSDDLFAKERLGKCYQLIEADPSIGIVCTGVQCIDSSGQALHQIRSAPLYLNRGKRSHEDQVIPLDLFADNFLISTSNIFCSISLVNHVSPFREFRYCHDWDFFLRTTFESHLRLLHEPLLEYRIHSSNTLGEDRAGVYFEIAVVIADFLRRHELQDLLPQSHMILEEEVFKSLRYHYVDRMLATLLLRNYNDDEWESVVTSLFQKGDNSLYVAGTKHIRQLIENDACASQVFSENKELNMKLEKLEKEKRCSPSFFYRVGAIVKACIHQVRGGW